MVEVFQSKCAGGRGRSIHPASVHEVSTCTLKPKTPPSWAAFLILAGYAALLAFCQFLLCILRGEGAEGVEEGEGGAVGDAVF